MIIQILNIGLPKKELFHGKEFMTGMCKKPVTTPLVLTKHGFEGDGVGDLKNHGGSDKAVCVYGLDHYEYWEKILGRKMPDAAFGENFSVTDMKEDDVCIGDIYQAGSATVQVSQPRQPCSTLAARYGRDDFVKLVVDSGRTGFYLRVLEEGRVKPGDGLFLVEQDLRQVSIAFANRIYHYDRKNREGIEMVLAVPALSQSWRKSFLELKDRA
ncbi:MAG TPA: MOSC domain-containing protein [Nitrospirota bacterium]|nr:MOSC domain-containing protein [Nitrospirota bacterium]